MPPSDCLLHGGLMLNRMRVVVSLALAFACLAVAKDKKKSTLPDYILEARTYFVLIDPDAGTPVNAPLANKTAQDDVERALLNWGRLKPAQTMSMADLVVTVRTGNGKMARPTIDGEPTNDRPVVVQPSDSGIHIGAQQGRNPDAAQSGPQNSKPGLGSEIGPTEDAFLVYQGVGPDATALDRAPVWRYIAKNALRSPDVPAVAEFRKAIDAAVK
jgi:hypothetical protein